MFSYNRSYYGDSYNTSHKDSNISKFVSSIYISHLTQPTNPNLMLLSSIIFYITCFSCHSLTVPTLAHRTERTLPASRVENCLFLCFIHEHISQPSIKTWNTLITYNTGTNSAALSWLLLLKIMPFAPSNVGLAQ